MRNAHIQAAIARLRLTANIAAPTAKAKRRRWTLCAVVRIPRVSKSQKCGERPRGGRLALRFAVRTLCPIEERTFSIRELRPIIAGQSIQIPNYLPLTKRQFTDDPPCSLHSGAH